MPIQVEARRYLVFPALLFALVHVTLASCSSEDCTNAAYSSGVSVSLPDRSWQLVEFCVGETCGVPNEIVTVDSDPGEYPYRLTVVNADGEEVKREGVVKTESYFINGKGCDPRTANATLVVSDSGDVTIAHP